jgi:hypothetical protein
MEGSVSLEGELLGTDGKALTKPIAESVSPYAASPQPLSRTLLPDRDIYQMLRHDHLNVSRTQCGRHLARHGRDAIAGVRPPPWRPAECAGSRSERVVCVGRKIRGALNVAGITDVLTAGRGPVSGWHGSAAGLYLADLNRTGAVPCPRPGAARAGG